MSNTIMLYTVMPHEVSEDDLEKTVATVLSQLAPFLTEETIRTMWKQTNGEHDNNNVVKITIEKEPRKLGDFVVDKQHIN